MKFFVAGAETNDCQTHNIAFTLRQMGHDVVSLPAGVWRLRNNLWSRQLENANVSVNPWMRRYESSLLDLCEKENPDAVIFGTATVDPNVVRELKRRCKAPVVCWYTDSASNLRRLHCLDHEYDLTYFKDPDFALKLTKQLGIKAQHLEEACNSTWHVPGKSTKRSNEVLIAGSYYGYRVSMIRVLEQAGVPVAAYGNPPPKWSGDYLASAYKSLYLNEANKAAKFESALACLNTFSPLEASNSLNCRIFETCGSGGLLLTESRDAINRCFEADTEYLHYSSDDECLEKIEFLRNNPSVAEDIRQRASRRAHDEHTYEKRLEIIIDDLNRL